MKNKLKNYWKSHYDQSANLFKDSLYKQVGKTVNGIPVESGQLDIISNNIIDKLALKSDDILIDLCCGNGLITKSLAENVKKVIGIDFSKDLIKVAKVTNNAENISYISKDVLALNHEFFLQGSKLFMLEALQHFSIDMFRQLLAILSASSGVKFFIGSVPDKDRLWDYYDTEEKKLFYQRCEDENNPHMGYWWMKSDLESLAVENGFKVTFLRQNSQLYTSYYRFDCLFEKKNNG